MASPPNKLVETLLLIGMLVLLALHVGFHLYHALANVAIANRIPWNILVPIFCMFSIFSALYTIGWRHTLVFLALTLVLSYVFEVIGHYTGFPFGHYYYTNVLGAKIGPIPWVIPFAYFMLVYPAHLMTNLMIDGTPETPDRPWWRLLGAALLTAFIMTAWDLNYDPLMSSPGGFGAWVWTAGGPYFGIPFLNFFGWVLTCFVIGSAWGFIGPLVPHKPLGTPRRWVILLPILAFAVLGIGDMMVGHPIETRIMAPFTMGIAILASILRLYATKAWP